MAKSKKTTEPADSVEQAPVAPEQPVATASLKDLAAAFSQAFEAAKPPVKKTVFTRKKNSPWTPKPGEVKPKLKRKLYQHGLALVEDFLTPNQIALANKIRPGSYCDGFVKVIRRRDKGIDIDYPVKTVPHRIKLASFGVHTFDDLLQLCITEAAKPAKPAFDEDGDAI